MTSLLQKIKSLIISVDTKQDTLTPGDNISIVDNVISTSDNYVFKITSTLNANQSFSGGTTAKFDNIAFCLPITTAYNTGTYKYTIKKNGIYQLSFSMHLILEYHPNVEWQFLKTIRLLQLAGRPLQILRH